MSRSLLLTLVALLLTGQVFADTVKVAVASSFRPVVEALREPFAEEYGHQLRVSSAATAVLYHQLRRGADFHLFLAADRAHPDRLAEAGLAAAGGLFDYATGGLSLVAARDLAVPAELDEQSLRELLRDMPPRSVVIANPRTAPYGLAAKSLYQQLGLWEETAASRAEAPNVAHTLMFVSRGHAQLAFVATPLLSQDVDRRRVRVHALPEALNPAVIHRGVLLQSADNHKASREFVLFMQSHTAQQIIEQFGYRTPAAQTQ